MLDKSLLSAGLLVLALLAFGMWMMDSAKHVDQHGVAHTMAKKMHRDGNLSSDIESAGENAQADSGTQNASPPDASATADTHGTNSAGQNTDSTDAATTSTSDTQSSKPPIVKSFGNIYKDAEANSDEGTKTENESATDPSKADIKVDVKINGQAINSYRDVYKDKDKDTDQ